MARVALHIGEQIPPRYAHRFAPKPFTRPQLFACLVLKAFENTDYRGIVARLRDNPTLCAERGLKRVPHFTTLQKAARTLLSCQRVRRLLDTTVRRGLKRRRRIRRGSVDATGVEAGRISPYFARRRDRSSGKATTSRYTHCPKLRALCDCDTHLILAMHPTRGATPDVHQVQRTMKQLVPSVTLTALLADPGYDSEMNHAMLREQHKARTRIPASAGRPTRKPARGRYRRLMQCLFRRPERTCDSQRRQSETVFSMIKHHLSHAITSKGYSNRCRGCYCSIRRTI